MNSAMISKVEKARRYAEETDRIRFKSFSVSFRGGHADHTVTMNGEDFTYTCHFFEGHGTCAHVMAMQRILHDMLTDDQQVAGKPFSFSEV